jgi:YrbI family 3-deoxy-D-manno-octulosonate 8-phosphate phosphatase
VFSALTPVTSELLYSEFKNLYTKIDKGALKEQALKQACKKDSHPTSRVYGEVSAQIPLEANSAKNLEENKIQHNGIWQGANLKDVRLIVYDFDGVFTDNRVILREDGVESVIVNRADGLAIGILKDWGIKQIIITKERNNVVEARANKLTLTVIKGVDDKKAILIDYCKDNDIPLDKVVYIGNDINDIEAMKCVGYPVCPQDAYKEVRDISKIILDVPGGAGVVRNLLKYF